MQPIVFSWDFIREILEQTREEIDHILPLIPRGNVTIQPIEDIEIIRDLISLRMSFQKIYDRAVFLMKTEYNEAETPNSKKEISEYFNVLTCVIPVLLEKVDLGLEVSGVDIHNITKLEKTVPIIDLNNYIEAFLFFVYPRYSRPVDKIMLQDFVAFVDENTNEENLTEPQPDYQYADDYEKSCAEEAEAMKNTVILNRMNKGGYKDV